MATSTQNVHRAPWPFMSQTFSEESSLAAVIRFLRRRGASGCAYTSNNWRLSYESRINRAKREREGHAAISVTANTLTSYTQH